MQTKRPPALVPLVLVGFLCGSVLHRRVATWETCVGCWCLSWAGKQHPTHLFSFEQPLRGGDQTCFNRFYMSSRVYLEYLGWVSLGS